MYEGTVSLRLRDDRGQVMAQGYATAASHSWTVEAFEVSAEDGAIVYSVKLPVWVGR